MQTDSAVSVNVNFSDVIEQQIAIIEKEAGSVAESQWRVGRAVQACYEVVEEGKWDHFLNVILPGRTLVSGRTLRRAWNIFTRVPEIDKFHEFGKGLMYLLTSSSTPESALREILALPHPTPEDAELIRDKHALIIEVSANAAATMEQALNDTFDEVRDVVRRWGACEPGVIRILEKYWEKEREAFTDIALSGQMQWEGEKQAELRPVKLATATTEDAAAVYASVRKAHNIVDHEGDRPEIHIKASVYVLRAEPQADPVTGEIRNTITFAVDEKDMRRASDKLVGTYQTLIVQELKERI